jgi:predicted membrane chloride channel (bestrophin family)
VLTKQLREANISFVMPVPSPSVYLPVRMEQLISRWTDFREIWGLLLNSVKNIQVSLTLDKKNTHFL